MLLCELLPLVATTTECDRITTRNSMMFVPDQKLQIADSGMPLSAEVSAVIARKERVKQACSQGRNAPGLNE